MSVIQKIRQQLQKELQPSKSKESYSVGSVAMAISDVPKITEKQNYDWVYYGDDNLYPLQIGDLIYGSAIHNSIIKNKSKMTAGDGLLVNGAVSTENSDVNVSKMTPELQKEYERFLLNAPNKDNLLKVIKKLSYDLQMYGAFCYEAIWNTDFTKIVCIKHVKVQNIRAGKMVNDQVKTYWYSRNWKDVKKYPPKEIPALTTENKKDDKTNNYNQIVYEKIGNLEYYGEPSYIGGLTWIQTDFQMGIFHLSNIENGMNPSMAMKFFKVPPTENDKQDILNEIQKRFVGPKKTGKHMVFFSEGKELAPEISPIQTSNLDKQLLNLAELCDRKILTAHQITSPLIFGISTPGQLGANTELKTAYQILDNMVIDYDRTLISDSLQNILNINKTDIKIKINPFDPFKEKAVIKTKNNINQAINTLSPLVANKVLESMTVDEIRQLVGLGKAETTTPTA